jgi:hypothetical protein
MAKQFLDYATSYWIFIVRAFFHIIGPTVVSFLVITQTIDMDTKWPQMGTWARFGFWIGLFWPGAQSFVALLDKSHEAAGKTYKDKQSGVTSLFTKDTGP